MLLIRLRERALPCGTGGQINLRPGIKIQCRSVNRLIVAIDHRASCAGVHAAVRQLKVHERLEHDQEIDNPRTSAAFAVDNDNTANALPTGHDTARMRSMEKEYKKKSEANAPRKAETEITEKEHRGGCKSRTVRFTS